MRLKGSSAPGLGYTVLTGHGYPGMETDEVAEKTASETGFVEEAFAGGE